MASAYQQAFAALEEMQRTPALNTPDLYERIISAAIQAWSNASDPRIRLSHEEIDHAVQQLCHGRDAMLAAQP